MEPKEALKKYQRLLGEMDTIRSSWFSHWRQLADMFLSRKYPALLGDAEYRKAQQINDKLLDSTSVRAINVLSSGMMNGITSPSRKWLRLGSKGYKDDPVADAYYAECADILLSVLANSNFYNAIAVLYHEWVTFGTAGMFVREDFEEVIRCYNLPVGEFYISVDNTGRVNRAGRRFTMTNENLRDEFGLDALPENIRGPVSRGERLLDVQQVNYIMEKNNPQDGLLKVGRPFRELFWLNANTLPEGREFLAIRGLHEFAGVFPRWLVYANSPYGASAAMEAYPDVIELQSMSLKYAQGLDKMVSPPLIVDQQLRNRPKALGAGGLTYAPNVNANFGARTAYDVRIPIGEVGMTLQQLRDRVREALHNDLFNMISNLDTVRSATEIDARREEKLVHLGPVLQRFYDEGLVPLVHRVFGIVKRAQLLPETPAGLEEDELNIRFESILSNAQMAADVTSIERFFSFTGNLAGVYPEARNIPNVDALVRRYASGLSIRADELRDPEEVSETTSAESQAAELAQTAETGKQFAEGARALSDVDVGGGMSAIQAMGGL